MDEWKEPDSSGNSSRTTYLGSQSHLGVIQYEGKGIILRVDKEIQGWKKDEDKRQTFSQDGPKGKAIQHIIFRATM